MKVAQFGRYLKETILYLIPHLQYVFPIPKILRNFFLYDHKLLANLSQDHTWKNSELGSV